MAIGIDHVVIAVRDLDEAIANFTEAGFTVTPGGEHVTRETHNALIPFQDGSYFEIIAWTNPDTPHDNVWWRRLQAGEGFVDYALRAVDLDAEVERLRASGLDTPDPKPGGRTRPDGERVEWQTVIFDKEAHPALPFYCHSTNDRELRVPSGHEAVHANGVTGIEAVFVGVDDLDVAERDYLHVAGLAAPAPPPGAVGENAWRSFLIGTVTVTLVQPREPDSELARSIAARGNVPIEVALVGPEDNAGPIDGALTHGAKLAIVPLASLHPEATAGR